MEQVNINIDETKDSISVSISEVVESVDVLVSDFPEQLTVTVIEPALEQVSVNATETIETVTVHVKDDASSYQIAIQNGFVGTEAEWLASLKGEPGSAGSKGDKGDKGEKGDTGNDGYTPQKGTDYFDGQQGNDGINGLTAFELAVLNGFAGTEPEWLASLKGEKGDKGDTGEKGDKGDQGDQGNTGAPGADVDPDTTQKLELLNRFKTGYGRYNEFVETGGNVTQINYWSAADKVLKLFTEDITYVSGAPTQIVVTDEITGAVLTTVFTYAAGKIINITDTFS